MSRIPKFGGDRSGRAAASTSRTIPDRSSYFQHESLCDPCAPQSSTRPETYSRIGSRVRQLRTPQVTSTPLATRAQRPDGVATPLPESLAARPGRYVVPAEYGPRTVKGMGMTYSSPQSLRGQMEAALPKHLKYSTSKPPHGFMDRRALQSTQLEDLFSGSFHVYERGPPRHDPSGIPFEDPDVLEQQNVGKAASQLRDFRIRASTLPDNYSAVCAGLASVHVGDCLQRTMFRIMNFTERTVPYLKLHAYFDAGALVLKPRACDVIDVFWRCLDALMAIGGGGDLYLAPPSVRGRTKGMFLCLTDEFVGSCKTAIAGNVEESFRPVWRYLDDLGAEFADIYADVTSELGPDVSFDDGCRLIERYKRHLQQVARIPDNEYFQIGQLVLSHYRDALRDRLTAIDDDIFRIICAEHLREVNDICDSFELIRTMAKRKPTTTDELIEIGNFMANVKDHQLDELVRRVHASTSSLSKIIVLGSLTERHVALNAGAIKWLEQIPPIIERHTVDFEQLKFEAEEKLQKVIEDVNAMVHEVHPLLVVLDEMDDVRRAKHYLNDITLHMEKIKGIQNQIEWINKEELCLSFPKSSYQEFEHLKGYVYPFYRLIKLCLDVQRRVSVWEHGQFDSLSYETTDATVTKYCRELSDAQKSYRKRLRQAQDENLPIRFKGTVDDPDLLNWPAPLKLCATAVRILDDFKPCLRVMKIMCNPALRARHWRTMSELAGGLDLTPNAGTTLRKLMEIDLRVDIAEYELVSVGATKELELLERLNSLKAQWRSIRFDVVDAEGATILDRLETVEVAIEDHLVGVGAMRCSAFVQAHDEEVLEFQAFLAKTSRAVTRWRVAQRLWLELRPLFTIEDLRRRTDSIHSAKTSFLLADDIIARYMRLISDDPIVRNVVRATDLATDVEECARLLEDASRGVGTFLEEVRLKCPRLYFVSDPELIALLGKRRNANETLPRIFPGVSSVDPVDERTVEVFGVARLERMVVECCAEVGFDELTKTLEERLVSSLKSKTDKCYRVFGKSGVGELVREYPQQVLQVLSRVAWTRDVAAGLGSSRNVRLLLLRKKIAEAIDVKVSLLDASDVSAAEKCSIRNWILTDIDNRNSLDAILAEGMPDGRSFRWLTQMRYTFENSACRITVLKHTLDYGYEYLGDGSLSVTTPTTYKCHLALLNAYFFNYHGAVRGVSGTGKLEIVSGLARALGFLFYRFGCSHATTPRVLMQLAKGGALCGCWLYLARIDSLTQRTLSVISQALVSIVDARRRGRAEVDVGGARVALKSTGFICAATDDVAALRKLPDNLKAAFRTYTVSRPDLRVVAEAMLLSEGFERWQTSASKLANCFSILEDVVPSLRRYSLRTLASIVKRCAEAKHLEPASNELEILRGSIEEALGAGVAPEDRRRFDDVVDGLFPDVVASGRPADVSVACSELGFSAGEVFVDRVRRTLDAVRTAPGVVLVGDAFVGKTSALKVCERLIGTEIGAEINVKVLNPSCFDCSEIFGTDDFLAGRRSTWIVLDELGSAGWVDAVTDCLGSRSVDDRVRFIFEGGDLKDASPSLVSHCRIIYFPPTTIEPLCLINSWINSTKFDWFVDFQQHVSPLLRWFLPACLALTKDSVSIPYGLNPNCLVKSALGLFEMLLEDAFSKTNKKDEDPKNVAAWIHAALLQSGLWSFGGCLNTDDRLKFDDSFKRLCRGHDDSRPYPSTVERLEVTVPHEATLFDYAYVYRQRGAWKLWSDLLKNEKISAPLYDEDDVFAPTVDAVRCGHFLDLHVKYGKRFLIVGPPGTGKSAILRNRFNAESPPADSKALINFGRDLVSARLRHLVLSKLNKTAAGSWAPPASKRLIFFVDDLHMARDPSPIELLRSHFDRNTLKTIRLEGCNFICTSGPPSSARMSRLLSHLDVFCVDESSSDVIVKIYAQTLLYAWKKSGFPSDVVVVAANQIARATLRLYRAASARLTPTPSRCHYAFDLASFSEAVKGCARLKREAYDANKQIYAKVWSGECLRVFGDRLYGPDYDWLRAEMKSVAAECFPDNCDGDDAHPKGIEEAELCAQYNARHKRKLNLVFFDYALKKFAILGRILSVPGANALLLGAAGSGRRTLAKLACFAHAHDYREPTVTTSYDETSWSRELKDALRECGATDRKRAIVASEVDPELVAELFGMSAADVSVVEDRAETDLINMSMQDPGATVYTRGHDVQEIPQQTIRTPSGLEPILQQTYTEKRVDKQRDAEKIVRNISVVEIDETTGQAVRVTMSAQQIDPDYGLPSQGRDVTSVKETIAVTPSYTTTARDVTREVTRLTVDLDPVELERLVEEETEDVDNTLKMAPPELPLSPEKYGIKKRLRKLRMNSESMALLEQSVVNPMPTADGALSETPPEAIATILHAIESGVAPQCTPDQVFNSLFETKLPERAITLSSVGPGPLQDVVVPHELDMNVHKEAMTADLNKLTDVYRNTANIEELPYVDIFTKVMEGALDSTPGKGRTTRPFKPIMDEESPWGDEDIEAIVNTVGAEPIEILDPIDISELADLEKLETELTKGIEYFVDVDPVPYVSRVQLRGTHHPAWFPGYVYALPEFSSVVKLARNPDEVFYSSWKSCQPRMIPDHSLSISH